LEKERKEERRDKNKWIKAFFPRLLRLVLLHRRLVCV